MNDFSYLESPLSYYPCYIGIVDFLQADYYAANAARLGVALHASRPAITIPLVGKTLVQAGTTTAGSITAVFSVIGIAMGIWEVVGSAKKIQDGSELADEFREQANELEKVMKNLIELDEELQS